MRLFIILFLNTNIFKVLLHRLCMLLFLLNYHSNPNPYLFYSIGIVYHYTLYLLNCYSTKKYNILYLLHYLVLSHSLNCYIHKKLHILYLLHLLGLLYLSNCCNHKKHSLLYWLHCLVSYSLSLLFF